MKIIIQNVPQTSYFSKINILSTLSQRGIVLPKEVSEPTHDILMPRIMRRKVRQNRGFLPFVKNDFEPKVTNESTHNVGVADQKILSDSNFNHFL